MNHQYKQKRKNKLVMTTSREFFYLPNNIMRTPVNNVSNKLEIQMIRNNRQSNFIVGRNDWLSNRSKIKK